ncbi:hypothetical protein FRC16_005328, partial [Serendipita sp. 398]
GAGNVSNPMPNGNGAPAVPTNTPATSTPPATPPSPPSPPPEPQANLVVNWNGPGG